MVSVIRWLPQPMRVTLQGTFVACNSLYAWSYVQMDLVTYLVLHYGHHYPSQPAQCFHTLWIRSKPSQSIEQDALCTLKYHCTLSDHSIRSCIHFINSFISWSFTLYFQHSYLCFASIKCFAKKALPSTSWAPYVTAKLRYQLNKRVSVMSAL